jgi:hypothetical protein
VTVRWVWVFLDLPEPTAARGLDFWQAVTRTTRSPWRGDRDEFATLLPREGDAWLKVQRVGDGGGIHVDLDADEPLGSAAERLRALGGTVLDEMADGDGESDVVVCRSPGGFVFCLTRWRPGTGERGVARQGRESLLDQVCLDLPRDRYAAETAFWSQLTGWAVTDVGEPEFERLEPPGAMTRHPDGSGGLPVRFLLQRLDDAGGAVRAHVDLACRDRESEADRHVALGATRVRTGRDWVVLRDPDGLEYCCTVRDPLTGAHDPTESSTVAWGPVPSPQVRRSRVPRRRAPTTVVA